MKRGSDRATIADKRSPLTFEATREEPEPNGKGVDVAKAVQDDIEARAQMGKEKYGERLTSENGRDALNDLYQELLDGVMYLKQLQIERNNSS